MPHAKAFVLALAGAALLAGSAAAQSGKDPRDFMRDALQGDNSEVRLGALAAAQGASPEARRFGRMLQTDHARAKQQALPVARRLGLRPTPEMAPEARDELQKLRGMRGRDFDREFARYMVDDHQKDIAEFRDQSQGRGPTARLAAKTLPALEHHLQMAQDLQRRAG